MGRFLSSRLRAAFGTVALVTVAAILSLIALGLLVAAFAVWLASHIGTIPALLALGSGCLALAAVLVLIRAALVRQQRRAGQRAAEAAALRIAFDLIPRLGGRRATLLAASVLLGLAALLLGAPPPPAKDE